MRMRIVSLLAIPILLAAALSACSQVAPASPNVAPTASSAQPPAPTQAAPTTAAPTPSVGTTNVSPSSTPASGVRGTVTTGPTCPVQMPGDSACADRPVSGALLVALEGTREVGRTTSRVDGTYSLALPPGLYVIVPQPVKGLLGTANRSMVTVDAGAWVELDFVYDTGIRRAVGGSGQP